MYRVVYGRRIQVQQRLDALTAHAKVCSRISLGGPRLHLRSVTDRCPVSAVNIIEIFTEIFDQSICHGFSNRRAFFEYFASVPFQVGTVLICKTNWGLPSQFCSSRFTQLLCKLWAAIIIESNEAAVERGIPRAPTGASHCARQVYPRRFHNPSRA